MGIIAKLGTSCFATSTMRGRLLLFSRLPPDVAGIQTELDESFWIVLANNCLDTNDPKNCNVEDPFVYAHIFLTELGCSKRKVSTQRMNFGA